MPPSGNSEIDWTAADSLCMQRGFCDDGWDYTCVDGRLINKIIKDSIAKNPPVYGRLKKFFSTKDGGTKKTNNTIYGHYKTEASEYITSAARRGVDLRQQRTCTCLVPPCFVLVASSSTHAVVVLVSFSHAQKSSLTIPVHVFREGVQSVLLRLRDCLLTTKLKKPELLTATTRRTLTFKTLPTRLPT
jgi:hypothetical protein